MRYLAFIFLFLCVIKFNARGQNKLLEYKNIIIVSDLSSRLNYLPNKDLIVINDKLNYFRNFCVQPGKKIGDRSSIFFSSFSNGPIISIDLEDYDKLGIAAKQNFINSNGAFKGKGLDSQINAFKNKVNIQYKNIKNPGLDLISLLHDKIQTESSFKIKTTKKNKSGNNSTTIMFQNHIYILTDGYLEFITKNASQEFYFGSKEIQKLRNYCRLFKLNLSSALTKMPSLGLSKVYSPKNQHINLHIIETHERDRDFNTQTYKNPLGLRDNEILEAVWRKWAIESGFKSFEWKKY